MIRISEIKLPLLLATDMGHSNAEIKAAILKKLSIVEADLAGFNIFKRGVDARKRNAILLAYIVDCKIKNEAKVLAKIATFSNKKITIQNTIDPTIIGGFILRIGDMQYNASVASKLQELKREFSN